MPGSLLILLLTHFVASAFMTGVIWFVQLVHYPLFVLVAPEHFREYERRHQILTTRVVVGPMLVELGTALALLAGGVLHPVFLMASAALGFVWLSTFVLQVPSHARLAHGFDPKLIRSLVRGNWWRTFLWTGRTIALGCWLLVEPLSDRPLFFSH